ncbi:hypothetical protein [Viscerimonas tarda]
MMILKKNSMRRIFFNVVILLFTINITAQEKKDYMFFISSIDELKTKYAVKQYLYESVEVPEKDYWKFYNLSLDEQNMVLDYVITLYDQKEYANLYQLGRRLLSRFYDKRNNKDIQSRIIEIHLDKRYYMYTISFSYWGYVDNYSEKAKLRLLNILENRKTSEDIDAWRVLAEAIVNTSHGKSIEIDVRNIMKNERIENEEIEQLLLDSILQQRIDEEIQEYEKYPPLGNDGDLYEIGSSGDKQFIPALEAILEKDYYASMFGRWSEWEWNFKRTNLQKACTYALAKLGVQKYIDEIFENDEEINYQYLGTKEAFLRWLEINYVWNEVSSFKVEGGIPDPKAFVFICRAMNYIENLPRGLRLTIKDIEEYIAPSSEKIKDYDPLKDGQNKGIIEKVFKLHQWIMDNKEYLELPPAKDR